MGLRRTICRLSSWISGLAADVTSADMTAADFAAGLTAGLATLFLLGGCASGPRSHDYAHEGPPAKIPQHVATHAATRQANASPRIEPLDSYANRPYDALGRHYVPITRDVPFRQRGIASWYGRQFQGKRTTSGEPYDMFAMTAAHPTLPIPSYARVTNLRNGRSVIVRVNDRGPFLFHRVIDLSYAAAMKIGIAGPGTGEVEVDRITDREIADASTSHPRPDTGGTGGRPETRAGPSADPSTNPRTNAHANIPVKLHWAVQVGAFSSPARADALRDRLDRQLGAAPADRLSAATRHARVDHQHRLNRVLIGDTPNQKDALNMAQRLSRLLGRKTIVFAYEAGPSARGSSSLLPAQIAR